MKFSIYNIPVDDGEYVIVYNTINQSLIRIHRGDYVVDNDKLIKGGFVVEDDCDEVLLYENYYLKQLYKEYALNVTISTTLDCNLHCPYCFEEGHKRDVYLSKEGCDKIITFVKTKGKKGARIIWFGGEPMLNHKAISYITKALIKEGINFNSSIISNGTIMPEDFVRQIDSLKIDSVQVTLDGNEFSHNRKRFFASQQGTYRIILKNIRNLLENTNAKVIIKFNLDTENINSYLRTKREVEDYLRASLINESHLEITHNLVRNITDFEGSTACLADDENFDFFYNETEPGNLLTSFMGPCAYRQENTFVFSPDGAVHKCLQQVGDNSDSIGNVFQSTLNLKRLSQWKLSNLPFEAEDCRKCRVLPLCGGGCPIDILKNGHHKCPPIKRRIEKVVRDYYNVIKGMK